jgi:hypothetical protein
VDEDFLGGMSRKSGDQTGSWWLLHVPVHALVVVVFVLLLPLLFFALPVYNSRLVDVSGLARTIKG